jgi:hypothetical protein
MASKKEQSFHWSREARRVQVLNDGRNLRIFDHAGLAFVLQDRDANCAFELQALLAYIADHDKECAERIYSELPEVWRERADRNLTKPDDEDEVIR